MIVKIESKIRIGSIIAKLKSIRKWESLYFNSNSYSLL
jgi:hypothetical protein